TLNNAETLVYSTEKTIKDFEGKVDEAKLKPITEKVGELKKLLEPEDKDISVIKAKLEEVEKMVQEASTEMYQKAAAEQQAKQQADNADNAGSKGAAGTDGKDEKVVDADYEVEDEKAESDEKSENADAEKTEKSECVDKKE
ncbi:Hsp70 family protein, partial [Candidatus Woesearchaeota archaeon]|nr:Hsp70 family protein [Candidatus Woesearchaeota archaeon]